MTTATLFFRIQFAISDKAFLFLVGRNFDYFKGFCRYRPFFDCAFGTPFFLSDYIHILALPTIHETANGCASYYLEKFKGNITASKPHVYRTIKLNVSI